jgi:hypothetical protein
MLVRNTVQLYKHEFPQSPYQLNSSTLRTKLIIITVFCLV